ncbi:hypothetical protein I597_0353 [Dokdonia donghaensis DSW-1]|nr:hypothetical protein I597_0353 [Dokdonia donghaensis DSW-1]
MLIMKTMKFLIMLIFSSLFIVSCAPEDLIEQEENMITANSTAALQTVIIGNRNRLKQKPRRNYKSTIVVDDPTNSVITALVQYTSLEGENPFPEPFEMEVSTIRKSIRKMQKIQSMISDTGLFPAGRPFEQTVTLYNELGEPVGDTSKTWVTAQDNDGTTITRIESKYLTPTSIAIPVRLRTDQPEGVTVTAQVELYGRILIKGQPLEMEMTVYDETEGNIGLTGTAVAQLEALTEGSNILPDDEVKISITTTNANGEIIDEDIFITPVELTSSHNAVKSSKTFVFGQTAYLETRVSTEAGENITQITATVSQQGEQNFEPFTVELFPVSSNENTIKFRSVAQVNPVFTAQPDAMNNILHQLVPTDTEGNTLEEVTLLAPTTVLEGITRNPKHIIRPNGITHIRMGLKKPIAQEVGYATMQIPSNVGIGSEDVVTLEASATSENDPIFRIDGDFVYTYVTEIPNGANYTTQVTTYNTANEIIGVEEVTFTINDKQTPAIESENAVIFKTTPANRIRIKGTIQVKPTAGAPVNTSGPMTSRIIVPGGTINGTDLIMDFALIPVGDDSEIYSYEGVYNDVNTTIFKNYFETEVIILDEVNDTIGTGNIPFEVLEVAEITLTQNEDGETFTLSIYVSGPQSEIIERIATFLTPQDGGSDADPEDFTLNLVENNTFDGMTFRNTNVTFTNPDSVIDMQYLAEITFLNSQGTDLDYLEFDIVGEE